jgi:hypothetical protein
MRHRASEWAERKASEWRRYLGHILHSELLMLLDEAIEEGKRQDREWLKAQDRGYFAASSDSVSHQGTGAYWAYKLEDRDKKPKLQKA